MEFPAEIEQHLFTKVHVLANPNYQPADGNCIESAPTSKIEVKEMDKDGYLYAAIQRVQMTSDSATECPYEIDVECFGKIRISPSVENRNERQQAALRVAHQVLYAAVREMIAGVTSRSVHGPMTIGLSFLRAPPTQGSLTTAKPVKPPAKKSGAKLNNRVAIKKPATPKKGAKGR